MRGQPLHSRWMLLWWMRRVNRTNATLKSWSRWLSAYDKRMTDDAINSYVKQKEAVS